MINFFILSLGALNVVFSTSIINEVDETKVVETSIKDYPDEIKIEDPIEIDPLTV